MVKITEVVIGIDNVAGGYVLEKEDSQYREDEEDQEYQGTYI